MIIVRSLMGALFIFGSVVYFFKLFPQPAMTGNIKVFMDGVTASGYLMNLIKATELVCGIAFILGRFVPLAAVILFPIVINILLVDIYLMPTALPAAVILLLGNLFLAYYYRNNYKGLLAVK